MEDAQDYGRAIKVTMLMFGPLAEKMGTREIEVNMPDGTTMFQLAERFGLEGILHLLETPVISAFTASGSFLTTARALTIL